MSYRNPSLKQSFRLSTPIRLGVAAVAACFIAAPAFSNPVNPTVVNGTASFNQAGNVLTVTNSNGAIINWDKFSIQRGETTHFAQTSASSSVMNRVLNDPTVIYGTLSSNGRVWLVNPAGIFVGPGGRVDVAAFVATTANVTNGDFLANRLRFDAGVGAGNVVNQGRITTPLGGSVYLIGNNVTNEGIITTPQGETILAAGNKIELIDSATPGVKVEIIGGEGNATNLGTITAEAGRIGIAGVIVKNSGQLNASSVVSEGGRIFLKASQDAYVDGNGRIVTTGTKGGSVEVLGNRVAVTDKAEIDVSGTSGGGRIMVGGDYQGKNPDIQNASITYFGPNASLRADATEVGDGGTAIVWGDDTTRAYGNISARGGARGGNGGFVETSGKRYLDAQGIRVDVGASNGEGGLWLLDPSDINIVASGMSDTSYSGGVFSYGGSVGMLFAGDINNALLGGSVTIQTSGGGGGAGNITATGVMISGGGSNSLTLAAYGGASATGNININNSMIFVNGGVNLLAGWDGSGFTSADIISGKGDINVSGSKVQSNGGPVNFWAGKDITLSSSGGFGTWVQGASMNIAAGNNLTLTGGSGDISSEQGPGVMLYSTGSQTVTAVNEILLQAGSANNTMYGGSMSGGSVGIWSDADQTISANTIKLYAGTSGHDNGAELRAYHGQAINITGSGGLLELKGGGDSSAAVYGGAGSYNNQARIEHGQWVSNDTYTGTGNQTITIYGGGSVNLQAGSGTGALGHYDNDCYAVLGDACRGSSNDAAIYNGVGAQKLDFVPGGGSLTVTGGSAGTQNWAGINNKASASTQQILGDPNITLTGGSGGGSALSYGYQTFQLSNDAGINSDGTGAQTIHAGSIVIHGGGAAFGGAGIGSESGTSLNVTTTGGLSMYGGSNAGSDPLAAVAYIGNMSGGAIDLTVGGDLYMQSGGAGGAAMIGSVGAPSNVIAKVTGNVTVDGSLGAAGIGSFGGYGGVVTIRAQDITFVGANARMTHGPSASPTAAMGITLLAKGNLDLGLSSNDTYGGSVLMVSGWDGISTTTPATYGGSTGYIAGDFYTTSFTTRGGAFTALAAGDISLGSIVTEGYSGANGGDVALTAVNGTLEVSSIGGRGSYGGGRGANVTLWSKGDMNVGYGGNTAVDATGGNRGYGDNGYGGPGSAGGTGGQGGVIDITSQAGNITVYGSIVANGGNGGGGGNGGYASGNGVVRAFNGGEGGTGGDGRSITLDAKAGSITIIGAGLYANGGDGGLGGTGGVAYAYAAGDTGGVGYGGMGARGGTGGQGGSILLKTAGNYKTIQLDGATLQANGGWGGNGGDGGYGEGYGASSPGYGYGGAGGMGGTGGQGGSITLAGGGTGGISMINGSQLWASGGRGRWGGDGSEGYGSQDDTSFSGAGGAGGAGGNAAATAISVTSAGTISVVGGALHADGGDGGWGGWGDRWGSYGSGGQGGTGGKGGAGGGILLQSTAIGGSITLNSATQLYAKGGDGGEGGEGGYSYSSYGGNGGQGGAGGTGGGIELRADAGSSTISLVTGAQLNAGGGGGGDGGFSGSGDLGSGVGGVGGAGGNGGRINVFGGDILGDGTALFAVSGGMGGYDRDASLTSGAGGNGGHVGLDTTGGIYLDNFQVAVNGGTGAVEGNGGDILIAFDGELSYSATPSMLTALSPSSSIQLATGNVLTIATALSTTGTLQLTSGSDGGLVIDAAVGGYNVELGAPTIDINAPVTASNNVSLGGATINLYAGVTANGTSATKSSIVIDGIAYAYSGVAFAAKDVYAYGGSAFLSATHSTSDVSGLVTGNITLDNGAYFVAGHDVDLTLRGSESTLALSNGGYVLANALTTISLAFTSRSSGGVMIDGLETIKPGPSGSGLYIGSYGNPATPGAGLDLAYASNAVVDPCVINPTLCKVADKPPTESDVPPPPPPKGAGDDLSKNTGGTEGTFGGEESGSGDKGNGKDEKDKKDKDKKSDEAKDEKKDEKPAQKKVANCQP